MATSRSAPLITIAALCCPLFATSSPRGQRLCTSVRAEYVFACSPSNGSTQDRCSAALVQLT